MIPTYQSRKPQLACPESAGHDPQHTATGLVWGALLGSAFWLMVLVLALSG